MALLTREQILAAADRPRETVLVPEWGGEVIVATLTGTQRDTFEDAIMIMRNGKMDGVKLIDLRAKLVAMAIVDEDGKRLFADSDVAALGQKSASALLRVFEVAQKLSGMTAKDVEELSGN